MPASSINPMPKPSTPILLLIVCRLRTFFATSAAIRFSGIPDSPKPPSMMVAPSGMSATAASKPSSTLFIWKLLSPAKAQRFMGTNSYSTFETSFAVTGRSGSTISAQEEAYVPLIDLPDVRTHYRWDGPDDKPVLLFANGLGTNLTMWDGQIAEFSRHFRVLRYDARGHGESSVPPGPYSIEQLGRDTLALIDALGVESCFFCGLSMGGAIGQWLGVNAPGRVRKLVLCNTAAKIGTAESWNTRIDLVLKSGVAAAIPLVLDRWFTPAFQKNAPDVVARTREMFVATDPAGYVAGCAAVRDMDQREMIHEIKVPTLIVSGTYDAVAPPAEGKFLAESIAEAKYVELPAAHLSNVEAPAEFASAVMGFLAE